MSPDIEKPSGPKTPDASLGDAVTIDQLVTSYGDLLFDLCESILWSPINAQLAFRAILKKLKASLGQELYETHQRAWVLRIACTQLLSFARRNARKVTPAEQIQVDGSKSIGMKLNQFDFYFHRLFVEDQVLLLLHDKYSLPFSEISSAMAIPEDSLKVRRQQALRTLEEWIWDSA